MKATDIENDELILFKDARFIFLNLFSMSTYDAKPRAIDTNIRDIFSRSVIGL
ncbi:hypothetical protein VEE35_15070 [Escherichia coli]|nr:hypothetical protein VEE35_15070 [Escherichia coli]